MTGHACRLCGEPVTVDGDGHVEHRDGLGSHPAELLTRPERWQARHVESGVTIPCRDQAEAEAHVRESVSGSWIAEQVNRPGSTTPDADR